MNTENICLSSKTIEIAEHDLYLELTNRLCYYDDQNLNTVMLPYKGCEDNALSYANTLVNMPVQAKYKKVNGKDDLGSHELHLSPDGDVIWGTESIGVHTEVWISDDSVITVAGETKVLPCLFAKCRIWKRNPNIISAIKRLFESDNGLNSSWEISVSSYEFKKGIKILTEYEFYGNCFLGSSVTPAYKGTSTTLSLSELTESELMVAEALSQDIISHGLDKLNNQEKEDDILNKDEKTIVSSESNVEDVIDTNKEITSDTEPTEETNETSEKKKDEDDQTDDTNDVDDTDDIDNPDDDDDKKKPSETSKKKKCTSSEETETSALTVYDLYDKINRACRNKLDKWCYVSYLFPEEHEVWCRYDAESELDYLKFIYSVEEDEVSVSEPEKVTLTVSVKDIDTTVAEYQKTIAEKDELIVKASSEITSLKCENSELSQYKEKFTKMEQEKMESELQEQKANLIASVVKSGQITKEEIETSDELLEYVNNLDKTSLMTIVGERLIASIEKKSDEEVETSEKKELHVASNLNNEDDEIVDKASIMRKFLHK